MSHNLLKCSTLAVNMKHRFILGTELQFDFEIFLKDSFSKPKLHKCRQPNAEGLSLKKLKDLRQV